MATGTLSAVVLAAGEGSRMRSSRPKPLHRLCGRPMLLHVLDALGGLDVGRVVVVVGHGAPQVEQVLSELAPTRAAVEVVHQHEQLGTGDAVAVGLTGLPDDPGGEDDVVVLPGDTPLLRPPTLASLVRHHRRQDAAATLLTAELADAAGYGRVVRGKEGAVVRVVEEADATPDERELSEVNTSIYCFRRSVLAPSLRRLQPANEQREYYLTDVVGVLSEAGYDVEALVAADPVEAAGVNDRAQLALAERVLRGRINERWMRRGVTMWDPDRTYVDAGVELDRDVTLLPGVILRGESAVGAGAEIGPDCTLVDTRVGAGAEIGPGCTLVGSRVGERAQILHGVCTGAAIGAGARVGPFASLGPGSEVAPGSTVPPFTSRGGPSLAARAETEVPGAPSEGEGHAGAPRRSTR